MIVAAVAAMACALPGNYLLLRRQSMMGDALSHTSLLGVVVAFLVVGWLRGAGWITPDTYDATWHALLFVGALAIGILSALLTELVQKLGRVEASAALGVVFISFFAAGLLLIRLAADDAHIDPDCVLYGLLETQVLHTVSFGWVEIPVAAISNGIMLLVNLLLLLVFYKELRISAFDPGLATTLGINASVMHYALMGVTAATVVTAFESVGSILVIAMLIVPPATAHLLTDRLHVMIGLSLVIAAASGFLGHVMARTLPPMIFQPLGYNIQDASTAGMMAVAAGFLFVLAALFGPKYGSISRLIDRLRINLRVACEDVLGLLFRLEEEQRERAGVGPSQLPGRKPLMMKLALSRLSRKQMVLASDNGYELTDTGRSAAKKLVRSHRLFEMYMVTHFDIPHDHLHETAARVEHYIDADMRSEMSSELDAPAEDPHGRRIPS